MSRYTDTLNTFKGIKTGIVPVVPIYHTAACEGAGITLKEFASDAGKMAEAMLRAHKVLGFDGVQLTLGVATEAEAMGAKTQQPEKGLPAVTEHLLEDISVLKKLKVPDPYSDGRMPLFLKAVKQAQDAVRDRAVVVATVRGPFITAGQLRGLSSLMMDSFDNPGFLKDLLEFSSEITFRFTEALIKTTGVKVVAFGEALCSPDFISPEMYKELIAPVHRKLMKRVHETGLEAAVIHICGNVYPIFDAVLDIGVDCADIDAKADLAGILELNSKAKKPVGLRGNLEPSWLLKASPDEVAEKCKETISAARNVPWILSSGCDVPYGTPEINMKAMSEAAKRGI